MICANWEFGATGSTNAKVSALGTATEIGMQNVCQSRIASAGTLLTVIASQAKMNSRTPPMRGEVLFAKRWSWTPRWTTLREFPVMPE